MGAWPPGNRRVSLILALLVLLAIPASSAAAPRRSAISAGVCFRAREGCEGLRPADLHSAYSLPVEAASPQTIAIIGIEDDPRIEKDLKVYDTEFELPECVRATGCFEKYNGAGKHNSLPPESAGNSRETALDVEAAHAICQNCHIALVEAAANSLEAVEEAVETAASKIGATEISISWGGPEPASVPREGAAFDHPGVVMTASSGDTGFMNWGSEPAEQGAAEYPASSPYVIAVGGTHLTLGPSGEWEQETLWPGSGSGCSKLFAAPLWQQQLEAWPSVGCGGQRAVADVAMDADPYTGMAFYDSVPFEGSVPQWRIGGRTSLGAPLLAAAFALAGGARGVAYPARTLYENLRAHPRSLHDVAGGSNGECAKLSCTTAEEAAACHEEAICVAGPGYDGPTGVGSIDGLEALIPHQPQTIAFTSTPPAGALAGGAPYALGAQATSGLPVSFSSLTPAVCSVEASTAQFLAGGECVIAADQAGGPEWEPAPQVRQAIAVQTPAPGPPQTHGGSVLSYTSSAGPAGPPELRLVAAPTFDPRTGAVSLLLRAGAPGVARWQLTFANGSFGVVVGRPSPCRSGMRRFRGGCRPALALFSSGSESLTATGAVRLTARPGHAALLALRRALARGRPLRVTALVTLSAAGGGVPSRLQTLISVRLRAH